MRIGIDTLFEHPAIGTGGVVYLQLLIKTLAAIDRENEYFVFVSRSNRHWFEVEQPNFRFIVYPFSNEKMVVRILEQQFLFAAHSRALELDVFFSPGNQMPLVGAIPTVVKIHEAAFVYVPNKMNGAAPKLRTWYRRTMIARSARLSRQIITNSFTYRDALCKVIGADPEKFTVVHDPVDVDFFSPAKTEEHLETLKKYNITGPYLLFVSALWEAKRPEAAIETLRICKQRYGIPHKLVLVGGESGSVAGRMRFLQQYARERGLGEEVVFAGHIRDRAVVRDFYRGAEAFLFPSISETFGIPPVEAIACGCPVVASNRAAVPEIVGKAALIADPDRPEEMAEAVQKILHNRDFRADLVQKGIQYAQKFHKDNIIDQTLEVLLNVGKTKKIKTHL